MSGVQDLDDGGLVMEGYTMEWSADTDSIYQGRGFVGKAQDEGHATNLAKAHNEDIEELQNTIDLLREQCARDTKRLMQAKHFILELSCSTEIVRCPFDPVVMMPQPLKGNFPCPICGDKVIAGQPHPPEPSETALAEIEDYFKWKRGE